MDDLIRLSPKGPLEPRAVPVFTEPRSVSPQSDVGESAVQPEGVGTSLELDRGANGPRVEEGSRLEEGEKDGGSSEREEVSMQQAEGELGATNRAVDKGRALRREAGEKENGKGGSLLSGGKSPRKGPGAEAKEEVMAKFLTGMGAQASGNGAAANGPQEQRPSTGAEQRSAGDATPVSPSRIDKSEAGSAPRAPIAGHCADVGEPGEISEVLTATPSVELSSRGGGGTENASPSVSGISSYGSGLSSYGSGNFASIREEVSLHGSARRLATLRRLEALVW